MLNQRRAAILRRILAEVQPGPAVASLAAEHGVSERLIRYDIEAIAEWVRKRGAWLTSEPSLGIGLAGDLEGVQRDLQKLGGHVPNPVEYVLSPVERRQRIIEVLLLAAGRVTVPHLAQRLSVSRGTVYADLEGIELWLSSFGLALDKRQNAGVQIVGEEVDWRRAACAFLAERVGPEDLTRWILDEERAVLEWPEPQGLVSGSDISIVVNSIRNVGTACGLTLSDLSFGELVLYLAVACQRMRSGKAVTGEPGDGDVRTWEWQTAGALLEEIAAARSVTVPVSERVLLAQHLKQACARMEGHRLTTGAGDLDLDLAMAFVQRVEILLGVELRRDLDLIPGLALHLRPIPFRLRQSPPVQNPVLTQIQAAFPELYRAARTASTVLEQAWHQPVPDAEVGFLTMHLGAAMERIKVQPAKKPRVLVVCGTGIGTARLLASRLEASVPDLSLVGITSVIGMEAFLNAAACDLVISTCRAPNVAVPVVQVSPLLLAQDIRAIRKALETGPMTDPTTRKGHQPMLTEILTPATIRLDVPADTWEEAVTAAGALLTEAGAADPAYGEAMVESVRQIGPYIVIAPGIALPHARSTDGVRHLAIAMLRLKSPVRFGHQTNDPVDLVFALAAVDPDSHLKALTQLSTLLSSDTGVARLREAPDIQGVMAILNEATQ